MIPVSSRSNYSVLALVPALLIPAWIGLYWLLVPFAPDAMILIFRPVILVLSFAFLVLWCRQPVTQAEQKLALVLSVVCILLLPPSLYATDAHRALQEWLKLVLICAVSLAVCRALRHPPTARVFGVGLIVASVLTGLLIVKTYLQYMGLALPTYASLRVFKGRAGIPLNPIAFECAFAYICGMCLLRGNRFLYALGVVLLAITTTLTGSRAPVVALLAAGFVLLLINAVRSRRLFIWVAGWLSITAVLLGVPALIFYLSFQQMAEITEHRWDVWSIALQRFYERPIMGYGYLSWPEALSTNFHLTGGGFHNEFLTALAEQGLIGFIAFMLLLWFLTRYSWNLAFRPFQTYHNGQWAVFTCLVLLFRAGVEVPGLFGYAQEPADFLAYCFLAIVVSRFSVEEDHLRTESRNQAGSQAKRLFRRAGTRSEEALHA